MTSPPPPDAVVTAQALTGALNGLTDRLDAVRQGSEERDKALARTVRRNRRMITVTAASVLLDIALTVVVSIVAVQAHSASSSAAQTKNASVVACQESNVTRAQETGLWTHLVQVSEAGPHPGQTPAQLRKNAQQASAFLAYVGQVFKARDCGAHSR